MEVLQWRERKNAKSVNNFSVKWLHSAKILTLKGLMGIPEAIAIVPPNRRITVKVLKEAISLVSKPFSRPLLVFTHFKCVWNSKCFLENHALLPAWVEGRQRRNEGLRAVSRLFMAKRSINSSGQAIKLGEGSGRGGWKGSFFGALKKVESNVMPVLTKAAYNFQDVPVNSWTRTSSFAFNWIMSVTR